ncbi:serine/threonine-protein kinase, partial [Cryptosporangium minutisporangium]|uniref:serine/threonine-protein kinase n=1 Tax=Cryptosporangium minutisporangium TaxID=113569 RepID=UPI0035E52D1C
MDAVGHLIGGRYRPIAEIGRGGMGVVWRALDERLGREVAVKALAVPPLSTDAERAAMVARAMQEARTAGALDHPNIVAVYDVVEEAGQPFIVMRLVRGHSLDRVVAAAGPLPPDIAARLGLTVLDALAAAHRAGVVHRDVKPANVLIQPDGTVLLSDFSIASALGGSARTAAGVLLGTPGYIAPERLIQGTAGPPADLFALGATLYVAVEGGEAFEAADALSGLFAVATAPHRPPVRAGALAPIIDGLLAKDPAQRPDADATAEALRAIAAPDGRALAAL